MVECFKLRRDGQIWINFSDALLFALLVEWLVEWSGGWYGEWFVELLVVWLNVYSVDGRMVR